MKNGGVYMKIEEIVRNLSLYERIILKIHKRLFTKVYHCIRIELINNILK